MNLKNQAIKIIDDLRGEGKWDRGSDHPE
jgi:hypothetical protein